MHCFWIKISKNQTKILSKLLRFYQMNGWKWSLRNFSIRTLHSKYIFSSSISILTHSNATYSIDFTSKIHQKIYWHIFVAVSKIALFNAYISVDGSILRIGSRFRNERIYIDAWVRLFLTMYAMLLVNSKCCTKKSE